MNNNFKKIYILIFLLLPFLIYYIFRINKKESNIEYKHFDRFINDIYIHEPELLKFDNDGKAIIKMDYLIEHYNFIMTFNSEMDECVGYIVVTNNNGILYSDYSHICDLIDY